MNRSERILSILTQELQPSHIELHDNSHKHIGHAGASPDGETHYHLSIACPQFRGMTRVKTHQAILTLLKSEFDSGLHALSIEAKATLEPK